jgi:hypothetical protein
MSSLQLAAILTSLMDQLRANGSWCGHKDVQEATYFLQDLLGVPTGLDFTLYYNTPYSFELEEELTALRAHYLIEFDFKTPDDYGPGLKPTSTSVELRERHPVTLGKYARAIDFVARTFGPMELAQLVRLATAFYVTRELGAAADDARRIERLKELKPFLSSLDALATLHELDRIAAQAKALATETTHV